MLFGPCIFAMLFEAPYNTHVAQATLQPPQDQDSSSPSEARRAFTSVHYINGDAATDRRVYMERLMARTGLSAQRYPAVNGSLMLAKTALAGRHQFHVTEDTMSEHTYRNTLGCRMSHMQLWRHLAATGRPGERYLIFEDDVALPRNFSALVHGIMAAAPPGWDVLRLACRLETADATDHFCPGCMAEVPGAANASDGVVDSVIKMHDDPNAQMCDVSTYPSCGYVSGGTHAAIYNFESLPRVMAGINARRINIDTAISMPSDPHLNSYCLQGIPGVGTRGGAFPTTRINGTSMEDPMWRVQQLEADTDIPHIQ